MKTLVRLGASTLTFLLLISPISGQDWSLQLKQFPKSVYIVEAKLTEDTGHCSGVSIANDVVLTAAHCVPLDPTSRAVSVDEKHADIARVNVPLDLAVLRVGGLGGHPVTIHKDELLPGLPVAVIGYGFAAHRLKYGFGWIADARDNSLRAAGDRLYFSAVGVVPGDSGGAVVDFSGKLCSIVQGVLFAGPSALGYGPPSAVIDDFVKPFLEKPK